MYYYLGMIQLEERKPKEEISYFYKALPYCGENDLEKKILELK